MNEEALDTVNALKTEHATRVLAKLNELKAAIADEPDLWFGGLPPAFEELNRMVDHRSDNIRTVFQLNTPVSE